ncbi:5467_t:CDS:2, partial [Acaulospora morrowiae]
NGHQLSHSHYAPMKFEIHDHPDFSFSILNYVVTPFEHKAKSDRFLIRENRFSTKKFLSRRAISVVTRDGKFYKHDLGIRKISIKFVWCQSVEY